MVRLDFAGDFRTPERLEGVTQALLDGVERTLGVPARHDTSDNRLRHIIKELHERGGQRVVVLIDEYDKPILDTLGNPEVARANRDFLRGL